MVDIDTTSISLASLPRCNTIAPQSTFPYSLPSTPSETIFPTLNHPLHSVDALLSSLYHELRRKLVYYEVMYATTSCMALAAQYCEEDINSSVVGFEERVKGSRWWGMGTRLWNDMLYRYWVRWNEGKKNSQGECGECEKVYWGRREMLRQLMWAFWIRDNEKKEREYAKDGKRKHAGEDILETDDLVLTLDLSLTSLAAEFDALELDNEDRTLVESWRDGFTSST
ncbi:hypothetical protein BKA66DRAFT_574602 [Pyrenochaeta sp. MPI-SDFR-AT-0127]|nr:hypothetical protein BKA66DRAFT_574602 [Pyrenochaeta sp. MPI-SDFR-AT-0127]